MANAQRETYKGLHLNNIATIVIRLYQRFVSPYKGFRCAHACLHKGASCSNAVLAIVKQHGFFRGYANIKARLHACKLAHATLQLNAQEDSNKRKKKEKTAMTRCDPSAACDAASCAGKGKHCDLAELPCSCWP